MSALFEYFRSIYGPSPSLKGSTCSLSRNETNDATNDGSQETISKSEISISSGIALKKFKNETTEALKKYLMKRLVEEDSDDDSPEEDDNDKDEDEDISEFNTQEQIIPNLETQDAQTPSKTKTMKRRNRKIPCITQTTHICEGDLNTLNLETKLLHIRHSYVTQLWNLRKTRRVYPQVRKKMTRLQPSSSNLLPLLHPVNFEFDGPFQWIYHQVISFELTMMPENKKQSRGQEQSPDSIATYVQNALLSHHHHAKDDEVKRIRVFLYDHYAEEFQAAREKHYSVKDKDSLPLIVSLEQIPDKCIFPYYDSAQSVPHRLLNCQGQIGKLSEYCVCIGGKCSLKFNNNEHLHFDDDHLRIRMQSQGKEYIIKKNQKLISVDVGVDPPVDLSHLKSGIHQHMKRKLESNQSLRNLKRHANNSFKTYVYTKLLDLKDLALQNKSISKEVNIYGAVLGFSCISRTKTGNFFVKISLIDESLPTSSSGKIPHVTLLIFSSDEKNIPTFTKAGDIIRAHRVNAQIFQESIQLIAHKSSSFLVCRPNHNYKDLSIPWFNPWQQTSPLSKDAWVLTSREGWKIKTVPSDFECMHHLWQWVQNRLMTTATIAESSKMTISALPQDDDNSNTFPHHEQFQGDLTVMITAIIPAFQPWSHFSPRGYLRVWDGTGRPSSDPLPTPDCIFNTSQYDPPVEALVRIQQIILAINKVSKGESIDAPKQLSGRVINVAIWECSCWEFIQKRIADGNIHVGKFVRLRNVKEGILPSSSTRALMLHDKSFLTPLPDYTFEVMELLINHKNRILRKEPFNNRCGILPLNRFDQGTIDKGELNSFNITQTNSSEKASCLTECISKPGCGSFQVKVTIDRCFPTLDFSASDGECLSPLCIWSQETDEYIFQFALRLKDGDNELEAIVSNQIAQKFFNISATELESGSKQSFLPPKLQDAITIAKRVFINKEIVCCIIRSILLSECKYFILESMVLDSEKSNSASCDDNSAVLANFVI